MRRLVEVQGLWYTQILVTSLSRYQRRGNLLQIKWEFLQECTHIFTFAQLLPPSIGQLLLKGFRLSVRLLLQADFVHAAEFLNVSQHLMPHCKLYKQKTLRF